MTRPRAPKPPALAPCAPSGPMAAPLWAMRPAQCRCGVAVYPVRMAPGVNDWAWATASGERVRDDRPAALCADPKQWWADLAENNIGAYSGLSAAIALGHWAWFHNHGPDKPMPHDGPAVRFDVPWCHDSPMWASPDGWVCRVAKGAPARGYIPVTP